MATIVLGMKTEEVCKTLRSVDHNLENKLEEVVEKILEKAKNSSLSVSKELAFYEAHQMVLHAFDEIKSWSKETFKTSPEKEMAEAWVNTCFYRCQGPRSIEAKVVQILSPKL